MQWHKAESRIIQTRNVLLLDVFPPNSLVFTIHLRTYQGFNQLDVPTSPNLLQSIIVRQSVFHFSEICIAQQQCILIVNSLPIHLVLLSPGNRLASESSMICDAVTAPPALPTQCFATWGLRHRSARRLVNMGLTLLRSFVA